MRCYGNRGILNSIFFCSSSQNTKVKKY